MSRDCSDRQVSRLRWAYECLGRLCAHQARGPCSDLDGSCANGSENFAADHGLVYARVIYPACASFDFCPVALKGIDGRLPPAVLCRSVLERGFGDAADDTLIPIKHCEHYADVKVVLESFRLGGRKWH